METLAFPRAVVAINRAGRGRLALLGWLGPRGQGRAVAGRWERVAELAEYPARLDEIALAGGAMDIAGMTRRRMVADVRRARFPTTPAGEGLP